jgi:predicted nucleotide-binding protein
MKERFEGDNIPQLIAALLRQELCFGNAELAQLLTQTGELQEFAKGTLIISEGAEDNDVYFLVAGSVAIVVKGNQIAQRKAGEPVGEMSAIEPSLKRSATVVAQETVVALKLSSLEFSKAAAQFPHIWPSISRILARRLQQRNDLIRAPNESPKLFIMSSREALDVAREVDAALQRDVFCRVWNEGVFFAGGYPLDDLERSVEESDFAVAVCEPDDIIESRGGRSPTLRDNVLFELGLFMGRLTRSRAFLVHPRIKDLKLPSDLHGLTLLSYEPVKDPSELPARLGPACNEIRKAVKTLGVRKLLG